MKQFSNGDTIDGGLTISFGYMSDYFQQAGTQCTKAGWIGAGDKFVGVKYQDSTGTYYGRIRINVASYSVFTIKDYSLNMPTHSTQGISSYDQLNSELNIHPNPCSGKLIIQHPGIKIKRYSLITIDGKELSLTASPNGEVDVSTLPEGLYFLKVETDQRILTKKIVIQR